MNGARGRFLKPPLEARHAGVTGWIETQRRHPWGELVWLLVLVLGALVHSSALLYAYAHLELTDFAAFVDNARGWWEGTPYPAESRDPNVPHVILFFVPFLWLPLGMALAVWLAASYVFAGLSLRLIAREVTPNLSSPFALPAIALIAASPPVLIVVGMGNMIFPLWWLFTVAWVAARSGREAQGAAIVGVLMTAKPFLGLWLPYFALRRQWRSLGVASAAAAVSLGAAIIVTGLPAWIAWLDMLDRIDWYHLHFNASVMGVLARFGHADPRPWFAAAAPIALGTAWWLRRRSTDVDRDWAILVLACMLMAPLAWRYYLLFAVGPLFASWARGRLDRIAVSAVLVFAYSPVPEAAGADGIVKLTVGSWLFWLLLLAWIAVGRSRVSSTA